MTRRHGLTAEDYDPRDGHDPALEDRPDPADLAPDLPPCDGTGELHLCARNPHSWHNGPHYWCDTIDCPGCPNCDPENPNPTEENR